MHVINIAACLVQEFMAEVEVRAAHNVLEACAQTATINKVVFTSSVTAVIWRDGRDTMSSDVDERHWSDVNLCKKYKVYTIYQGLYIYIYIFGKL
jgi:nucleoside-diphosphate-sugar epimerase